MSENREEILANFQSITAIEDVAEAIYHLDESNWDLLVAIHRVLPQDPQDQRAASGGGSSVNLNSGNSGTTSAFANYSNNLNSLEAIANVEELMTAPSSPIKNAFGVGSSDASSNNQSLDADFSFDDPFGITEPGASTSRSNSNNDFRSALNYLDTKPHEVIFKIHFNNELHSISISNHATVGDLKAKICEKTAVPVCRQALKGWEHGKQKGVQNSNTVLKSLNIGKEVNLIMTDMTVEGFVGDTDPLSLQNKQTYTLHINVQPEAEMLVLKFPGHQNILSIKTDVYTVTSIPVRHQVWSGWPNNVTNNTTLAESGVEREHNLVLKRADQDGAPKITNNNNATNTASTSTSSSSRNVYNSDSMPIVIDSESSGEEFEDASDFNNDDDIFTETPINSHLKHLIPDNVDDETIGSIQFVENFVERYGPQHPMFFQGSLEDALKEACRPSARDRKLMAIYLHHDGSVLTNVFCGQLLACESIIQMLLDHYVLFGWDLTFESNKNMFLSSISACVGMTASITVRNIPTDRLPAILVISKNRSQCEVFQVIYGNVSVDDLLSQLMEAADMYSEQLKIELREENERLAREQVKLEQDAAYRESLEADRAKQEAKRQKELMMQTERRRLESERADAEAKRELIRANARITVPPEPEQISGENITKIRIRPPSGPMIERRFTLDTPLRILLNFITGEGFLIDEYKVISSWPRRDLTVLNLDETLRQLKLYPQETVILEER
ncbi:FAS-associated factor 1 isoform X1 [Malaya genurostris]|uniref:FAS-associated factor 1 isoform X1 n=1 Tax=Malaya genurostris TaxID=325434 RepID=UPI0026F40646|nr:FAS-associated factor 1 isoform X1 [Malaya genurostris]XP_058460484.1 FAS-associated factor 1 isoform X1 [Malaya genurostris]